MPLSKGGAMQQPLNRGQIKNGKLRSSLPPRKNRKGRACGWGMERENVATRRGGGSEGRDIGLREVGAPLLGNMARS